MQQVKNTLIKEATDTPVTKSKATKYFLENIIMNQKELFLSNFINEVNEISSIENDPLEKLKLEYFANSILSILDNTQGIIPKESHKPYLKDKFIMHHPSAIDDISLESSYIFKEQPKKIWKI